ncbi:response regulator transcription factor [Paenibacillus daejeonensis]|uniref:response regulator transcription factor n=1 Tax=Paenibacillus daejeonensis TaxID=135193 RepID=UPI0003714D26|nr:response regulator [Paenibacillus daejeonensis]
MLKLMLVDDESIIRDGILDMIEQEKSAFTHIVTASDGREALDKMEYFLPDLLITDIEMPEMDGLELIREARKKQVTHVIILSGYDLFEYAQQAVRLHVEDYLLKPVHQAELGRLLKSMAVDLLERKREEAGPQIRSESSPPARPNNEYIRLLKEYVENNYAQDLSLSSAAEYLGLHPSYMGQLLKKETGTTFVQYLTQLRMTKAKELLTQARQLPLATVAKCVGYENHRHFYKVFKQQCGVTPGEYRERQAGGIASSSPE